MKRTFSASTVREENWYVAQCLEVDVAGQGETPEEALQYLEEALALQFLSPVATVPTEVRAIEEEPDPLTEFNLIAVDVSASDLSTCHDWFAWARWAKRYHVRSWSPVPSRK